VKEIGKAIKVFCLFEQLPEMDSFLSSAMGETDTQRYLIRFIKPKSKPLKLNFSFEDGFILKIVHIPNTLTAKWKKETFNVFLKELFVNFPETSGRQNFFLDFSSAKTTKYVINFVETSIEKKLSEEGVLYSIFSLFFEKNISSKIINDLALNYPFICLKNAQIHPNFYFESETKSKLPSNVRDLFQPIQLLVEELERSNLEQERLNKELFLLNTHNNVLESSLASFFAIDRDDKEIIHESVPADLISLLQHRDLKKRYDEKTQMLSTVTHDLKSPLSAIQGFTEIIRDGFAGETTTEMQKHLEIILSNTKRLSRMIESILEYEKYDQSDYITKRETFDLVELVNDAKMSVLPQMIQKDQDIQIFTPNTLEMVGNRELILRVLQNVLDNAVKYSPPQKGKISVFVEEQNIQRRKLIKITIQDKGYGIAKKDLTRIFEPFTRFEPGSTSTGLGLSIVRKIVESLHNGTIEIASPGRKKGTTVTIYLPKS
jgi:signal transduction histidine kinase